MSENGVTTFARRLEGITKASWKTHFSGFLAPFQDHPCAVKLKSIEKVALLAILAPGHLRMGPLTTIPVSHPI